MGQETEHRIAPADITHEEQARLERMVAGEVRPVLLTKEGDVIELPKALNDLFVSAVQSMRQRQTIFLMHEDEAFTTQAAANFLGISRQHLVRMLEAGEIPFHQVGTHRRVFFRDLAAFRRKRSLQRREALDRMTDQLVSADLYDRYAPMDRSGPEQKAG